MTDPRLTPADENADGVQDTVPVDRNRDGVIDERDAPEAPVYRMPWGDGVELEVAVTDVRMEPRAAPTIRDVVARIQSDADARIAEVEAAADGAYRAAKKWLHWFVGTLSVSTVGGILCIVYYSAVLTGNLGTTVETVYQAPPAAEAWLESVRPLLDDPTTDEDDYSRGRDALGLEGE